MREETPIWSIKIIIVITSSYRNVSSFLPIFEYNIKPGSLPEDTLATEKNNWKRKKIENKIFRLESCLRNRELRFFGQRGGDETSLLSRRHPMISLTAKGKAGPFPKKYPRDRLKLERSSRGVNSLLKRLFLTRNCLKLVYTDTATARQKLIRTLSLSLPPFSLGPPYEILNAFNFSARLRLFPVDRPLYSPPRWQRGEEKNVWKKEKEKYARLKRGRSIKDVFLYDTNERI